MHICNKISNLTKSQPEVVNLNEWGGWYQSTSNKRENFSLYWLEACVKTCESVTSLSQDNCHGQFSRSSYVDQGMRWEQKRSWIQVLLHPIYDEGIFFKFQIEMVTNLFACYRDQVTSIIRMTWIDIISPSRWPIGNSVTFITCLYF